MYGAEGCLLTLVQHLDLSKFVPIVVVPAEGPLQARLHNLGVKTLVHRCEWWAKNEGDMCFGQQDSEARIQHLVEIIRDEVPDIVHTSTSVIWEGAVAASLTGTRHIWHIHEALEGHPSLSPLIPIPLLHKVIDLLSEVVVVVSSEAMAELARDIPKTKLVTIHNGIESSKYNPGSDNSLRTELGFAPNDIVALTVASLRKYKGVDNLIEAAAMTKTQDSRIKFVVAGKGPDETRNALLQTISRLDLADTVFLIGHRTDVPKLLAGADVFVLPSRKEGFPLVALEAMASGKPVVATDCGGTAEMIVNGETGFIVPVDDPQALAENICALCRNRETMSLMGMAAYKHFVKSYDAQIYVRRFQSLYEDLVATPRLATQPQRDPAMFRSLLDSYQRYINLMQQLANKEQDLALTKVEVVTAERIRTQLEKQLQAMAAKAAEYEQRCEALAELEQARELECIRLEGVLETREQQLAALLNSWSWRITSPLRKALDFFEKK